MTVFGKCYLLYKKYLSYTQQVYLNKISCVVKHFLSYKLTLYQASFSNPFCNILHGVTNLRCALLVVNMWYYVYFHCRCNICMNILKPFPAYVFTSILMIHVKMWGLGNTKQIYVIINGWLVEYFIKTARHIIYHFIDYTCLYSKVTLC